MSAFDTLVERDRVWAAISSAIIGSTRHHSRRGAETICCPMCIHRGTGADRRFRCGIFNDDQGIGINCYNCGFRSRFRVGDMLSRNMREFMAAIGVPANEIQHATAWAMQIHSMVVLRPDTTIRQNATPLAYPPRSLPQDAQTLLAWIEQGCDDPALMQAVEYLFGRGEELADFGAFYWTPTASKPGLNRRVIIPCRHDGEVVGWIARSTDPEITPKYDTDIPSDLLFNARALTVPHRKFAVCVEGAFDALAIDGIGLLGAKATQQQERWLNDTDIIKVVLPDRDQAGDALVDVALRNQWHVSFPWAGRNQWWDDGIKDAADAVRNYGRLYTVRSIMASATASPISIRALRHTLR